MTDRVINGWIAICVIAVAALLVLAFVGGASAQVVIGGSGSSTMIVKDGDVTNVGSILGEVEYQFPWGDVEGVAEPKHWGGLVAFLGLNSQGGGEIPGIGYRHYIHAGGVYPGFGLSAFALGENTPDIGELTIFMGVEGLLEIPASDEGDKITGFVGVYPAISGAEDLLVVRAGVRAAMN